MIIKKLMLIFIPVILLGSVTNAQKKALNLYWSGSREDNFTTSTTVGAESAIQAGYSFARVEG